MTRAAGDGPEEEAGYVDSDKLMEAIRWVWVMGSGCRTILSEIIGWAKGVRPTTLHGLVR